MTLVGPSSVTKWSDGYSKLEAMRIRPQRRFQPSLPGRRPGSFKAGKARGTTRAGRHSSPTERQTKGVRGDRNSQALWIGHTAS